MNVNDAKKLAIEYLARTWGEESKNSSIIDDITQDLGTGWVFFYQSNAYLKSGDFRYMLGGNAPLVVVKRDGSVHVTGTAYPVEHYIDQLRKAGVL